MGFDLWVSEDLAWAQGTYEYRPMGVAVIAASDLFRARDFRRTSPGPARSAAYMGQFASMGALNAYLQERRRKKRHLRT